MEAPLYSMESWCWEFVKNSTLQRDIRHGHGHLFPLSRWSRRTLLSEWGEAHGKDGPQFALHSSNLHENIPVYLKKKYHCNSCGSTDSCAWIQQRQVWPQLGQISPHLFWLQWDMDLNKDDDVEDTCKVSVIKKGLTYTHIRMCHFKFLYISKCLASGVSYSAFLKAYKIPEAKSYLPYKWFDHPSKLDFPCLPPYQTFHLELKQRNMLEMRDKRDDDADNGKEQDQNDKVLGARRYFSSMTFGKIKVWPHLVISWSIKTIWTLALSLKWWKKAKILFQSPYQPVQSGHLCSRHLS